MNAFDRWLASEAVGDQISLVRLTGSYQNAAATVLQELEIYLSGVLTSSDRPITEWRRQYTTDMLASVRSRISQVYTDLTDIADLPHVASSVSKKLVKDLRLVFNDAEAPSGAMLRALVDDTLIRGAPSGEWWSQQDQKVMFQFTNLVRMGQASGMTNGQMKRDLSAMMDISRREADALVRSSVMAVANEAREATLKNNQDVLRGMRFLATLDNRTTITCMGYAGSEWDFDGKPLNDLARALAGGYKKPPLHWGCRSTLVPLTKELKGIPAFEPPTRASMDGPVKGNLTFAAWLEAKPKAFQEDMLGVTKSRLWREGKLTLQQLLDFRGDPLTLEQLQERWGVVID